MNQVAPFRAGALTRNDPRRLQLFKDTVGKNLRDEEIDQALEWCGLYEANPFTGEIYFFVFDENKPSRRVVPVIAAKKYLALADATGNFRPDERAPRFVYDKNAIGPANPKGIVSCEVTVYVHKHGEWFPVTSCIRWDERAPIKEIWAEDEKTGRRKPTGKFELDPSKKNWRTMPETMHAKCTLVDAIRKTFPAKFGDSYEQAELDHVEARTIELTATEIINEHAKEKRAELLGGPRISFDFCDGEPLVGVPVGEIADKISAFIKESPDKAALFKERNSAPMNDFWAENKNDCLAVKKALEDAISRAPKIEETA